MEKEKIMEAIELAVKIDNIEMFEILLKDFDLNALDEDDRNYIYTKVIANAKSFRFVNRVLDLGCGINNVIEGKNLLHIAAMSNCVESVKFFLEKGLDIEAKSDAGLTPLIYAVFNNESTEVIHFLIDKGADIEAKSDGGYTPLMFAAGSKDSTEVIQFLIDKGADINALTYDGSNLLHLSAGYNKNLDVVKFFIDKFDIESRDNNGWTPLLSAANTQENLEVIQFLIDKGADINALTYGGENLLHLSAGCNKNLDVVKFFIDKFDIESRDNDGLTPLLSAAQTQEKLEVIKLLVDSGADIHAKAKEGSTVFHSAAMNKNPDIAEYFELLFSAFDHTDDVATVIEIALLQGKSEETINICFRKMITDMFMVAVQNENPCALKVLLDKGFSFKWGRGEAGFTLPMIAAAFSPNPDVLVFALEHERKIDAVDEDGRNLAHYAARNESTEMFEFVKDEELFKELLSHRDKKGNLPEYYLEHKDEF